MRFVRSALEKTKTPFAFASPVTSVDLPTTDLDAALGAKGKINGGAYQFSIARSALDHTNVATAAPAVAAAPRRLAPPLGGAVTAESAVTTTTRRVSPSTH